MNIAAESTQRALDINSMCPFSLALDGMVQGDRQKDFSLSKSRFKKATEHDPNHALAWLMFSRMHAFIGDGAEAVKYATKATELSPLDPFRYFYDILNAMAHNVARGHKTAEFLALKSLKSNPRHTSSYRVLAIAQQLLGHDADARQTVKKLMALEPGLTIDSNLQNHPASRQHVGREWAYALKSSGSAGVQNSAGLYDPITATGLLTARDGIVGFWQSATLDPKERPVNSAENLAAWS